MIYLKLGSLASFYTDPLSGINIIPQQVVAIADVTYNTSKELKNKVSRGHLVISDVTAYNTWINGLGAPGPDPIIPGQNNGSSSPETGSSIKTKLEALVGSNRLDASAIKNFPTPTFDTSITYIARSVATYTLAKAEATGSQKKIITVATDEDSGGTNTKYFYEGVEGVLEADFTKASSSQFQIVNGQEEINTTWLNSFIATYLSSNGFTAGGGGTNAAPVASSVAFTGTPTQGQTLTGTYTYSDAESNTEGTSLKKWYRSDNTSGLNRAAISGATSSTYVLQAADVGKFIQYAVTPVSTTGTTTGTEVFSVYSAVIAASGVSSGTALTSYQTLTGATPDAVGTLFNATSTISGVSTLKFAAGASGWAEMEMPNIGSDTGAGNTGYLIVGRTTNQFGVAGQDTLDAAVIIRSVGKVTAYMGGAGTGPSVTTDTASGVLSAGGKVRVLLDGVNLKVQYSQGGTTWTDVASIAQPNLNMWVKVSAQPTDQQRLLRIKTLGLS